MIKKPLRRRWMFIAFTALRATARYLPLSAAQVIGALLGYFAYALLMRYRALTWQHLRYAFGLALSRRVCHRISRGVFMNLGRTFMEWFVLGRLSPSRIRRLVEVHGLRHLHKVLKKGRGAIVLSAHFGNWELLAMALRGFGFKGGLLARRLRYPEYERFLWMMRRRHGVATYARGSIREAARLLAANQIVGMTPDQDVDSLEGVFVDFFGHAAYTPLGPAALSLVSGAELVPCFVIRAGRRFRLMIEEPIQIPRSGSRTQDLIEMTQAWSRVVEVYIRRYPNHWAWMHRRWKTQPETGDRRQGTGDKEGEQPHSIKEESRLQPVLPGVLPACRATIGTLLRGAGRCAVCCVLCAAMGCANPPSQSLQVPTATTADTSPSSEAATQEMNSFTMDSYAADGTKRWTLEGTGASVEGGLTTIQKPRATGYDPTRSSYLTASLAQINQQTRHVRMEHEVTIHTSDGLWLTSPLMYWLPDRDELLTDQPVRLETDHMLLRARGATAHTQLDTAVFLRDVELVLNPSSESASGMTADAADGPSHVTITCDGPLSFDYERNIATFEQNVHVQDRKGELYSDRLIAYLDRTSRTIRYAEAIGRVRIVQGANTAMSERAIYEPARSKVTLLGSPSLVVYPEEDRVPGALTLGGIMGKPTEAPRSSTDLSAGQAMTSQAGMAQEERQIGQ